MTRCSFLLGIRFVKLHFGILATAEIFPKISCSFFPPKHSLGSSVIYNELYYFILLYTTLYWRVGIIFIMKNMNTQKPLKSKVSITLDEDVIRRIKELADADDRNFSQYINLVLKKHLEKKPNIDWPKQ